MELEAGPAAESAPVYAAGRDRSTTGVRTVSLVGSTGSIGTQAIDVVQAQPDAYRVVALGAARSVDRLVEQAALLRPERVGLADPERADELRQRLPPGTDLLVGPDALAAISTDADVIVNGVVGFAGLPVTLAALNAGRRLALANKESLIAAGPVVQSARATPGAEIIPVDSEHCAIHQCLRAIFTDKEMAALPVTPIGALRRIVLTASGGPFRGRTLQSLAEVTLDQALAHPTWNMGPKITIDSSTLMNKGLEVIEAHELFGLGYDDIEVVVHPQSIIHSMIETTDGATLAQLSFPDMRLPIGYALAYPDRLTTPFGALDWAKVGPLTFEPPDLEAFPCLDLAYRAGRLAGAAPAWLNGANEVAVAEFLDGRIRWVDIPAILAEVLDDYSPSAPSTVEHVLEADLAGRDLARRGRGALVARPAVTSLVEPSLIGPEGGSEPPPSVPSGPAEVVRLTVVVAAIIALGFVAGYGETILLILFLIGCIVAHEFGHYIAAKTGRVKVTEFFVGFGPRLWSIRRGETEYGVKGIPLGGYCRIIGMNNLEEVDPAEEDRTYRAAPLWRRLLIDVAGSSMHFVIALLVLFSMFFWTGDQGYYLTRLPPDNPIQSILAVQGGQSPAEKAGLHVGDRIEAIDGVHFTTYQAMAKYIQARPGQRLDLTVKRNGRLIHLYPTPIPEDSVHLVNGQKLPAGHVGFIGFSTSGVIHSSFTASVSQAGGAFVSAGAETFDALGHLVTLHGVSSYFHMLSSQKAAQTNPDQLTTVVALPSVLHQASQSGLPTVLWILALINISIGIINLLPFFPVDGGRVVVALYEGVRSIRRPYRVDMQKLLPVMYAMLTVFVLYSFGWILINLRTLSS